MVYVENPKEYSKTKTNKTRLLELVSQVSNFVGYTVNNQNQLYFCCSYSKMVAIIAIKSPSLILEFIPLEVMPYMYCVLYIYCMSELDLGDFILFCFYIPMTSLFYNWKFVDWVILFRPQ